MTMSQIVDRTVRQAVSLAPKGARGKKHFESSLKVASVALAAAWGKDATKLYAYMLDVAKGL